MLPVINSFSFECLGVHIGSRVHAGGSAPNSATWPSATLALGVPLNIDRSYTVKSTFTANGAAAAGNTEVSIYTLGGLQLMSTGAVTMSGTNVPQVYTLPTPVYLSPGSYMMFMGCSSTTAQFLRLSTTATRNAKMMGMAQIASGPPLASQVTLASTTSTYLPLFGISNYTLV